MSNFTSGGEPSIKKLCSRNETNKIDLTEYFKNILGQKIYWSFTPQQLFKFFKTPIGEAIKVYICPIAVQDNFLWVAVVGRNNGKYYGRYSYELVDCITPNHIYNEIIDQVSQQSFFIK